MFSAVVCALLLVPGQAEKAVTIPDADLLAIGDTKHPKHKETADKYDGKVVKLSGPFQYSGGVAAGNPYSSYSWVRNLDGKAKGPIQVVAVEWSDTPGTKEAKAKIAKGPRTVSMTLYGRFKSGGAGVATLADTAVSESKVPAKP